MIALLSTACGGDDDEAASTVEPIATGAGDTSTSAEPAVTSSSPDAGTSTVAPAGRVDAFQAVMIAGREGPGTVVDLDRDDGMWEVEVRLEDGSGVELDIEVDTGEVVDRSGESVPSPPPIGIEEAMTSAMEAAPGGDVTQAELDDEDGRLIWEIVVERGPDDDDNEIDVDVDATTGEVVSVESDDG